jgi:flagellar assembly protein FliH
LLNREADKEHLYVPVNYDSGAGMLSAKDKLARAEAEAYEKGMAQGMASGQKMISEIAGRLESVIRSLEGFRDKKTAELLPEIIDLSLEIAKKIIQCNIEKDRGIIVSSVRTALAKLGGREDKIFIRVNPADYDIMLSNLDVLKEEFRLRDVTIEPVESVTAGGCFIETPSGDVDARIEEQLKEIRDAIATAIHS